MFGMLGMLGEAEHIDGTCPKDFEMVSDWWNGLAVINWSLGFEEELMIIPSGNLT
jgi:hypothetical protein